jgi:hypothetical protein
MVRGKEGASQLNINEFGPNTLESAAHEAAMADGLIPIESSADLKLKKAGLRRGKWTTEEEAYANRLIYEFKLGLLPLTDGTTLRTFLSKLLNCDPMRISKKFVGQNCIGKVSYSYLCSTSPVLLCCRAVLCCAVLTVFCVGYINSKYFVEDNKIWKNLPWNKLI